MTGKKKKVVIIGGGITGLSAAFYMQKEIREQNLQAETVLIESSPRLGGKIQTVHKDGFIIERGPDSFLERKTSGPQFVKDVGLGSELVNNATGRSYVLVGDRLHPIPAGAVMGIPTQIMPFVTTGLFFRSWKSTGCRRLYHACRQRAGRPVIGSLFQKAPWK